MKVIKFLDRIVLIYIVLMAGILLVIWFYDPQSRTTFLSDNKFYFFTVALEMLYQIIFLRFYPLKEN